MSESLIDKAREVIDSRGADYPDPVVNFKRISDVASILMGYHISPADCCKVLIALKIAREGNKHKEDNLMDLIAYTEILNRIIDNE